MAEVIVGIDLGTTNSLIAICDGMGARVLAGPDGERILPSVVRYEPDGGVVVGARAKREAAQNLGATVSSVKRLMGRSPRDAREDLAHLPYTVVEGKRRTARIKLPSGREVSPEEVSAAILAALRERASVALGVEVRKAVVTVPAYFDDAQRLATRDAGRLAGLDVVRIVNEPTAAALAYGLGAAKHPAPKMVAIYDLGGGTFDISILRITPADDGGSPSIFQVLATSGDTRLGGDDFDHLLELHLAALAGGERGLAPWEAIDAGTRSALAQAAVAVKHRLSQEETAEAVVALPGGAPWRRQITRAEFEALVQPLVDRTLRACDGAIRDASRAPGGGGTLDAVIMVGGATRMPIIRREVSAMFGMPAYTAIDPDEAVALGAAVQGSILAAGAGASALLLDVVPLSLGIETTGGGNAKLILRNSTIPARASERFSTSVDGQSSVKVHVIQGEREMAADCRSLGQFELRGIPPMPAGIPQLEVQFLVDANGVLNVSAVEHRSGRRAELQVVPSHGLTREEVERLERESFAHAREDMERHRIADLVVNAGLDVKWISERLAKFGDRLADGERRDVEGHLARVRGLIERARVDWTSVPGNELHAAKEALARSSLRLQEISIAQSLREAGIEGR